MNSIKSKLLQKMVKVALCYSIKDIIDLSSNFLKFSIDLVLGNKFIGLSPFDELSFHLHSLLTVIFTNLNTN